MANLAAAKRSVGVLSGQQPLNFSLLSLSIFLLRQEGMSDATSS